MDLSNLEPTIKTNDKIPGKIKHELGSRIKEEFIALSPKIALKITQIKLKRKK